MVAARSPNVRAAPAQTPLLQFPHDPPAQDDRSAPPDSAAPSPPRFDPRSKLDVIYQEVLGDVAQLVDKLEKASGRLVRAEKEGEEIRKKIDGAHQAALSNLQRMLDDNLGAAVSSVRRAAADARASAQVVQREARRMVLLALCLGGAAGIIGGVLVVLALGPRLLVN